MAGDSSAAPPSPASGRDTSSRQVNVIVAWVVCTVLAVLIISLRFYTRRVIVRVFGIEDWLILISVMLAVAACASFVHETTAGLGRHAWTLSPQQLEQMGMENWLSFLFCAWSLAFTKLSILVLYLRILVRGPMRVACYIVLGIVTVCNAWVFINSFIACIPLEKNWKPGVPGTCIGRPIMWGNSILHIITDFMIFSLPLPALYRLRISPRQKIALVVVFSLGFFVCLMSIIRMVVIRAANMGDMSWDFAILAYWGAVEVNLAIVCGCLTTLKPLVDRYFPRLLASTVSTNSMPTTSIMHRDGQGQPQPRVVSNTLRDTEHGFGRLDDFSTRSTKLSHTLDACDLTDRSDWSRNVATSTDAYTKHES